MENTAKIKTEKNRPVFELLANAIVARKNCQRSNNREWFDVWMNRIGTIVNDHFPSGSGFDNGTHIDLEKSTAEKLVFNTAFHHMNEGGYYDGWTEHSVIVTASFIGNFTMKISGPNRRDIHEYIAQCFEHALTTRAQYRG